MAGRADNRFERVSYDPRFSRMKRDGVGNRTGKGPSVLDDRFRKALRQKLFRNRRSVDKFGRKVDKDQVAELSVLGHEANIDTHKSESDSHSESSSSGSSRVLDVEEHTRDTNPTNGQPESFQASEKRKSDRVQAYGEETSRIAIVNLDWDQIRAVDLLVTLRSLLPDGINPMSIRKITVYPSEFGLQRLEKDRRFGPSLEQYRRRAIESSRAQEIVSSSSESSCAANPERSNQESISSSSSDSENSVDDSTDDEQDDDIANEQIRQYELDKMRYYFAVAEFDSPRTALLIYESADGVELEKSGNVLDLQFVPDEMRFERKPRDSASDVPSDYVPVALNVSALLHSRPQLTWDGDDQTRAKTLRGRNFSKSQLLDDDFKAYLASSSSDEAETDNVLSKEQRRALLLQGTSIGPREMDGEPLENETLGEMEVTFHTGLEDLGKELLEKKNERVRRESESVWEARLRRIGERKQEKKLARKEVLEQLKSGPVEADDDSDQGSEEQRADEGSDDLGFDDPFFLEPEKSRSRARKQKSGEKKNEVNQDDLSRAELELLLLKESHSDAQRKNEISDSDSDSDSHGRRKGKRKRLSQRQFQKLKRKEKSGDHREAAPGFEADLTDQRFSAVFDSHEYSLDPTHPKFSQSRIHEKILQEKNRRNENSRQNRSALRSTPSRSVNGEVDAGRIAARLRERQMSKAHR